MNHLAILLGKNFKLKRANPWWTLSEILLPLAFIFLLVGLQRLDKDQRMPARDYTCPRATAFSPTLLVPHPNETTEETDFFFAVETIGFGPGLQTVPPLIYLLALAAKVESRIALVNGGGPREQAWLDSFAAQLDEWTAPLEHAGWKKLSDRLHGRINIPFCRFGKLAVRFDSERELDAYVQSPTYGEGEWHATPEGCPRDVAANATSKPKLHAALVLSSVGPDWRYAIRTNISIVPPTYPQVGFVDPLLIGVNEEYHDDYMMSGFLTLQLAVDRHIVNQPVRVTPQVRRAAVHSLCDSVDAVIEKVESLDDIPALKKIKCRAIVADLELGGLDLSPLVKPAAMLPTTVRLAPFPTPKYVDRPFFAKIENVLSLVLLLCYLWPTSRLLRGIVHEKETRLREQMKMMGIGQGPIMASWLVTYGVMFGLIALLITLVAHANLFSASDPFLVFSFFFLFGLDIVAFAFMISVLFDRAKTASTAGVSLFFAAYFAFFAVNSPNASASSKAAVSFLAPTAFGIGSMVLAHYESGGEGVQWSNAWDAPSPNDLSFATVLSYFIFDFLIYVALGFYLDQVVPSEFGVKRKWTFLCSPRFWKGEAEFDDALASSSSSAAAAAAGANDDDDDDVEQSVGAAVVEQVGPALQQLAQAKRCVTTSKLSRKFRTPGGGVKVALQGLDVTCYEGEIFCLLGQNGAGKSTTINLLTGMMQPSSGSARVLGLDVATQMDDIRRTMGVCPQHDCLWDELTVREHLAFVASVRGLGAGADKAIAQQISQVGLAEKTDARSCTLSGGQKRKLSLAMALLGNSRIVFLDEPTSGMDPYSRRFTWNLLQNNRAGRVIILTTHFMDEADALGDRIGIMAHGRLKLCGSSHFLKAHYGVGYTLTMVGERGASAEPGRKTPLSASMTTLVERMLPEASMLSSMGQEVTYQVPFEASKRFPALFKELDNNRDQVLAYGVSVTTLDTVFIRVSLEADADGGLLASPARYAASNGAAAVAAAVANSAQDHRSSTAAPERRFATNFTALFRKRVVYARRDRRSVCCNIVLPILLLVLGLGMLKAFPLPEPPTLLLKPASVSKAPDVVPWACAAPADAQCTDVGARIAGAFGIPSRELHAVNNTCAEDDASQIDYGEALKGHSRWLANKTVPASVFGSVRFDGGSNLETTVFANTSSMHAAAIYLNAVNEALLQGSGTIQVTNAPFHFTARFRELVSTFAAVSASISIIVAFSFIPASIAVFVVKEKEISAKHQQILAGTSLFAYWLANFCFDVATFVVPWAFGLVCIKAFGIDAFEEGEAFGAVALLFACYGLAVTPFTYLLSFFFTSHSTAQNVVLLVNFITGLVLMIASLVMSLIPSTMDVNMKLENVYRLFPGFCLGNGLLHLTINSSKKTFGDGEIIKAESSFAWDVIGGSVVFLVVESVVYLALVVLVDTLSSDPWLASRITHVCAPRWWRPATSTHPAHAALLEDEDVAREAQRVDAGAGPGDVITVEHLRKVYGGGKVAVSDLTFGIARGECFGFLGVNGAGKTTTLKMLTGDLLPTSGTAKIAGLDILEQQNKVRRLIGYCPQFDALLDLLTVREHLELYGRLKGVRETDLDAQVRRMMHALRVTEFEHRLAGTLSGGNKRKLSVAVALIGEPAVLILDEPTTGLDVVSRRFLCDVVADYARSHAVILTTHSMEEVEALCTQVGIIVAGTLCCFGAIQHLKSRFGKGVVLRMRLKDPESAAVNAVVSRLPAGALRDAAALRKACAALGNASRADRLNAEDATGWTVVAEMERSGSVTAAALAAWWAAEDEFERVDAKVKAVVNGLVLIERRGFHLTYRTMDLGALTLGSLFAFVEDIGLAEYSVCGTSLEQIFVAFSQQGAGGAGEDIVRGMF